MALDAMNSIGDWPRPFRTTYRRLEQKPRMPIDGISGEHALIVVDVSPTGVTVYDPLKGERVLPLASFEAAWAIMHNLTILVQQ